MRKAPWLAVLSAALCNATAAQPADRGLYLFQIEIEQTPDASPLGETVEAALYGPAASQLAERLAATSVATLAVDTDTVRVAIDRRELLAGDPHRGHQQPSFVVDFDEGTVGKLVRKLEAQHGEAPSVDELIDFVDKTIVLKSYRRNFDLASETAVSREGDCTEHAVLLAALARATGRPARVALGILLLETADGVGAFGHAWTEIHDGTAWQIADATQPQLLGTGADARYIPIVPLTDEGPGYTMSLAGLSAVFPARIGQVATIESAADR